MTDQTLQKALFTIKKLKSALQEQQNRSFEPIAITGLSCRFPQASSKPEFWQLLSEGRNVVSHFPERRWELLKGTDEIELRDATHPYWGGFFTNIDEFDAYFFGISPREAIRIDPQHRLILELAYEAIEDAGISVDAISGSNTGVFASLYVSQLTHLQKIDVEMDALYLPTGTAISIAANRLSYLLNLHGPSVIIDSACSSSMGALHLACLNLQNKNCDLALVCGAKLHLLPYVNFVLTKAKMLSPDGQCKTFDANANGYVQGEGAGVVVLKPLKQAIKDKDRIYAVITGSAMNQDGRTNGLTAPNGLQQEALLRKAYETAQINPHDISYVECHGTGTFLGDPIELQALGEVIGKQRDKNNPCSIGSVKTNLGHLEPAAGMASIIKTALALQHKKIPPHLNFETPNPHIAFDKYHFSIPRDLQDWPCYGENRLAGISGFGFGGTNCHIVMREVSQQEETELKTEMPTVQATEIFTISGKSNAAFLQLIDIWIDFLEQNPELNLAQICYCLHLRRTHYPNRLAIIANSLSELLVSLHLVKTNQHSQNKNIFITQEDTKKSTKQKITDIHSLDLQTIASLYVNKQNIPWQKFEEKRQFQNLDLPLHPWQHKSYWPPLGSKLSQTESVKNQHPLRGRQLFSPLQNLQFEFTVDNQVINDLKDTYNILHAGYYLEMLAFAVKQITQQERFTIEDHAFLSPLIATENTLVTVHLILEKINEDQFKFQFFSNTYGQKKWIEHANGKLQTAAEQSKKYDDLELIRERCDIHEVAEQLYTRIIDMDMPAGESIRWTHQYYLNEKEILCEFQQPHSTINKNEQFILNVHPGLFDACLQPIFRLLPDEFSQHPYIASGTQKVQFFGMKQGPFYLWGTLKEILPGGTKIFGECCLINKDNEVIASFDGVGLAQLDNKILVEKNMAGNSSLDANWFSLPLPERKKQIVEFLIEQVALIFSQPKHDIDTQCLLRDMGIDSLMALVLMRTIEVGLGVSYAMHDLLEGPSIDQIAEFIIANRKNESNAQPIFEPVKDDKWISFRNKQPHATMRLFCFPYGGGGASAYREWQEKLPEYIEVCPIQLPGRENRLDETPINHMDVVIDSVMTCLQAEKPLPFALFGHSFGSLIAFELIRQLRKKNRPLPYHLFVSAFPDPRVPTKSLDNLLKQLQAVNITLKDIDTSQAIENLSNLQITQLSNIFNENGIVGYDDYLLDKKVLKILLPIFIGDMNIVKSYQYYDTSPLDIPISVFVGKQDAWVSYEDHLSWTEHTTNKCEFYEFDSGHMFIKDSQIKTEMLRIIAEVSSS